MSASDQLSVIAEKLEALPDRLAAVLGSQTSGQGIARSSAADGGSGGRGTKTPSAWDSTERLLGSLGQFAPVFGKAAGAMRTAESAAKWGESIFGNSSTPDKKREPSQPTIAAARQTTLGSASQPSVMNTTRLASAAAGPGMQPIGPSGPGSSQAQGIGELTRTMQELNASVQQLKASMDQLDPNQSEDAERAQTQRQSMWQQEELPKSDQSSGQKEQASVQALLGTMRPQQNVPSTEQAAKGEGGGADAGDLVSMAMLAARFFAS